MPATSLGWAETASLQLGQARAMPAGPITSIVLSNHDDNGRGRRKNRIVRNSPFLPEAVFSIVNESPPRFQAKPSAPTLDLPAFVPIPGESNLRSGWDPGLLRE